MRKAAQITGAALVAAVLMTGCSSGSDDKKNKGDATPPPAPSATAAPTQGGSGAAGATDGGYAAQTADGLVGLSLSAGTATLVSDGGKHLCTGTVRGKSIDLKCPDGSTKRTMGLIEKSDATSMVVFWEGGDRETFVKKADAGQLPTALPSALPSNLPTDLPGLPKPGH
ncbi:hypothetical protein [Streptomyces mashuensis]|uniref:hypothetical protein n=1 Tax=Streptomyces mashuensis TaxID=33904 RepID=UPI00167E1AC8|nr:hypothetical protein [Streptomyces mashuensis]